MSDKQDKKPRNENSFWRRVILPLLGMATALVVGQYLYFVVIGAIIGASFESLTKYDSPGAILIGAGSWFAALGTILLFAKYFSKIPFSELGFTRPRLGRNYLIGLAIGAGMMGTIFAVNLALGAIDVEAPMNTAWASIVAFFVYFAIQGFTEEVMLRGYLLGQIMRKFGAWPAIIVSAIIFANLHGSNPDASVISWATLLLFGVFTGYLFVKTRNIWIVGGFHTMWNFTMGPLLGAEVSGRAVPTLFTTTAVEGQKLVNGGGFGFEGGITATLVFIIAIAVLMVVFNRQQETPQIEQTNE